MEFRVVATIPGRTVFSDTISDIGQGNCISDSGNQSNKTVSNSAAK